ncbi:hypothetical protein DFP72DRAFT_925829 [Ephemerocybe angulata]|uniref:DUF6533 domain-containing protein n=1 Tax=Ephemerocybe angulata TaxID=980116 RepID=A0A8H6HFT9_9AGAR|nr:hypothetical protein DFP72DRAFT_925829 [Tulosesus angulatus]
MDALDKLIHGYKDTKNTQYLGLSGHALVLADFLETFPDEVRLMWPTPLSLPKVLFFTLRYYVFVNSIFAVTYGIPTGMSPKQCSDAFMRISYSSILIMIASEAILSVRVYAFSGGNKKLLAFLVVQYIAIHASAFALLCKFNETVHFAEYPIKNLPCFPAEAKNILLSGVYALLLGSVIIAMLSMVYIAVRKHRNLNSGLIIVFYQDGIFYFICLSALATANIIVNLAAPSAGMKFLLVQAEVNIQVILSTRMLLHLRSWAEENQWRSHGSIPTSGAVAALDYSARLARRDQQTVSTLDLQFADRLTETVESQY